MSIGRIIRLAIIGSIVGMIAGMITALTVKRGMVPTTDETADEVELAAIFGPLSFRSTSSAFRGGLLEAWYGGGILDLRDATLAPEGATLRVRAIFGGVQVLVPADWKVISRVSGMGGLTDIREHRATPWTPRNWSSRARSSRPGSRCSPSRTMTGIGPRSSASVSDRAGASAGSWTGRRA